MPKRVKLPVFLTAAVLALVALIGLPGAAVGEEPFAGNPDKASLEQEMEGEISEAANEKFERKLERIDNLVEADVLAEEEAEDYIDALEEKASFERGECPEDGPRSCELRLNMSKHQGEQREENRAGNGASHSGNGFRGGW